MKKDPTLELLKKADPVREQDLPAPDGPGGRALKERILLDDQPLQQRDELGRPPLADSRWRRRLAPRLAAIGVAAILIALGALAVVPGDGIPPDNGPSTASAVERAVAALRGPGDTILHTVARVTAEIHDDTTQIEEWQLAEPPFSHRMTVDHGGGPIESGTVGGQSFDQGSYEPSTNTIHVDFPTTPQMEKQLREEQKKAEAPGFHPPLLWGTQGPEQQILDFLRSGEVREDGRVTVDGREAIRIVPTSKAPSDATAFTESFLVDAQTFEPIEWVTVIRVPNREDYTETMRFETYEWLPANEANLSLLSLRAQHPDAKLVDYPSFCVDLWKSQADSSSRVYKLQEGLRRQCPDAPPRSP